MTTVTFENTTALGVIHNGWWVGYIHEAVPNCWEVMLYLKWGAPRDCVVAYPTKELAIARARQELGLS